MTLLLAITGSTGFIGRELVAEVIRRKLPHTILGRNAVPPKGTTTVIDIAGLAHVHAQDDAFMQANYHRTVDLFRAAQAAGASRFIFLSSVAAEDPVSAYGKSKRAAEKVLLENSDELAVAAVRPPLVYGPDAPGNFKLLTKLALTPMPLPFASVRNRRSIIGRANLVDALLYLAHVKELPSDIYNVTDGTAASLDEIISAIRSANGLGRRLFSVDRKLMSSALTLLGLGRMASQLFDNLVYEDAKIRAMGWQPPIAHLSASELVSRQ